MLYRTSTPTPFSPTEKNTFHYVETGTRFKVKETSGVSRGGRQLTRETLTVVNTRVVQWTKVKGTKWKGDQIPPGHLWRKKVPNTLSRIFESIHTVNLWINSYRNFDRFLSSLVTSWSHYWEVRKNHKRQKYPCRSHGTRYPKGGVWPNNFFSL